MYLYDRMIIIKPIMRKRRMIMDKYGYEIGGHVLPLDEYLRSIISDNDYQEKDVIRVGWNHYTTTLDRLMKEAKDKMVNEHEPMLIPEGLTFVFTNGDVLFLTHTTDQYDNEHPEWMVVKGAGTGKDIDLMDVLNWAS
jgi:hypothetical protein